jgi:hypothetical protein
VIVLALPRLAHAQTTADVDGAHEHFARGIALYNEHHLDAALAELTRAYELAPAPAVLYNLGRVRAELGQPVEAARALEQYLAEGGDTIPHARRVEVEALLTEQRARIARVRVVANVEGSIVGLDGVDVARTPLSAPLEVGTGHHTLNVRAPGYESVTLALDVAGGDDREVGVTLRPAVVPRGALRVESSPDGVHVAIDGEEVGVTPLDATIPVPAGPHVVVGTRPGYLSDTRSVTVDDGAELDVHLRCEVDPSARASELGRLVLSLPHGRASLRIDGRETSALSLELTLPVGVHTLEIEIEDRSPWSGEVEIAPESARDLAPPLQWNPDVRRERVAGAAVMQDAGIGLAIAGGVALVAGLAVLIWNETQIAGTDSQVRALTDSYNQMRCDPAASTPPCDHIALDLAPPLRAQQHDEDTIRMASIGATIGAAALAGVGIAVALAAPTAESIDRDAHASLHIGPNGISVDGTF